MERWNPNLYHKGGLLQKFREDYLDCLIAEGRKMDSHRVPVIYSLAHLARLSRNLYSDLHGFVSRANVESNGFPYRSFTIGKRSGGRRWIAVPTPSLMAVQSWIAQNILNELPVHSAAHAYVEGMKNPLVTHASKHVGADWILHVDVKDFFSNISEKQVYRVFKSCDYPDLLAFEMARLCTRITPRRKGKRWSAQESEGVSGYSSKFIGSLPQGAPTSPALSNLAFTKIDSELEALAIKSNVSYSRYADDLCFSFGTSSRERVVSFNRSVSKILWKNSFSENRKKTRIIPPGSRKLVTGLVVNHDRPTVPKELRDRVRMHLYYSGKLGIPAHCRRKGFVSVIGFRNHLHGLINYIKSIDSALGSKLMSQFSKLPWASFNL